MFLKNFETTQASFPVLVSSILRQQKCGLFYLGKDQKMAKTKIFQKSVYMWHSEDKG